MKDTCVCLHTLGRLALLFALAVLFTISSFAQQDLEIMVSGPWTYVQDPNPKWDNSPKRLFLVAPSDCAPNGRGEDCKHGVYIAPGLDASMQRFMPLPSTSPSLCTTFICLKHSIGDKKTINLYYVDFDFATPGTSLNVQNEELEQTYKSTHNVSTTSVLYQAQPGSERYAISLPWPDYVRTYGGPEPGLAESRIEDGTVTIKTPMKPFTTWMVLHYSVKQMPSVVRLGIMTSKGISITSLNPISVEDYNGTTNCSNQACGVSLSLAETHPCTDTTCFNESLQECDELSGLSFAEYTKLWGLPEHARFPIQMSEQGDQYNFHYDFPNCNDAYGSDLQGARVRQQKAEDSNKALVLLIENLTSQLELLATSAEQNTTISSAIQSNADSKSKVNTDLENIETLFRNPLRGTAPAAEKEIDKALECTREIVNGLNHEGCPGNPTNLTDVIRDYYHFSQGPNDKYKNGLVAEPSKGSADCHSAQVAINSVFKGIK